MKKKYLSARWLLLATGIVAIVGLTGMNVYSLYALHKNTIASDKENKKLQVSEFSDKVRHRFFEPFVGFLSLDMEHVSDMFNKKGQFPKELTQLLDKAAQDSIFQNIYFIPSSSAACQKDNNNPLLIYNSRKHRLIKEASYPEMICDGMGIARTRMKVLIDDYRYNNKVIFETHRSMTIALVSLNHRKVIGYLSMLIDQPYMRQKYLQPMLKKTFGNTKKSGIIVWLRDWTKDKIIASSDPAISFDRDKVEFIQKFPNLFDNWYLAVAITNSPLVSESNSSLIKSLIFLGGAFFLLLGALVFMFITAQQERALVQRQAGFLANVTHELKTPLAVMQAAGENLADGRVDDKERLKLYGRHIYTEANRLRRMIEKLLDVAKTDAGQFIVNPEQAYPNKLLNKYVDEHKAFIESKGFTLRTSIPGKLPSIMIDKENFETIIGNIVENAMKYSTDEKFISITLRHIEQQIYLSIKDHGVGIPEKAINHIFEKFYRVEETLTAKTKGHGLGLSIVKDLVELNNGIIEVSSQEGDGTSFLITFPIYETPDDHQWDTPPANGFNQSSKLSEDTNDHAK